MKIKIKKETPFDKAGTVMSIKDFRLKYSYICVSKATDKELFDYINLFTLKPVENSIGDWFEAVHPYNPVTTLTEAVIDGILYMKQLDGFYHKFIMGNDINPENSIGCISINDFENKVKNSKYSKPILYCTNAVSKKL